MENLIHNAIIKYKESLGSIKSMLVKAQSMNVVKLSITGEVEYDDGDLNLKGHDICVILADGTFMRSRCFMDIEDMDGDEDELQQCFDHLQTLDSALIDHFQELIYFIYDCIDKDEEKQIELEFDSTTIAAQLEELSILFKNN